MNALVPNADVTEPDDVIDETEQVTGNSTEAIDAGRKTEVPAKPEGSVPLARLNKVIADKAKLQKELADLVKEQAAQKIQRLKESEDYKALYEQASGQLAEAASYKDKIGAYDEILSATLEASLAELTPEMRALVPEALPIDQQLAWVTKYKKVLAKPAGFDIGVGKRGVGNPKQVVKLTEEQAAIAASYGMSHEDYAKFNNV